MRSQSRLFSNLTVFLVAATCILSCRRDDHPVPPPTPPPAADGTGSGHHQKQMVTKINIDCGCDSRGCPHHKITFKNQKALISWFDHRGGGWVTIDPPDGVDQINLCGWPDPTNPLGCDPILNITDDSVMVTVSPGSTPGWKILMSPDGVAPLTDYLGGTRTSAMAMSRNVLVPFGSAGQPMQTIDYMGSTPSPTGGTIYSFNCTYGPKGPSPGGTIIVTVSVN